MFIKKLIKFILLEKYKYILVLFFVTISFFSVFKKFDQNLFKGRFAVEPGSYYTMNGNLQPEFNLVEKNQSLIDYLKSYPFFYDMKTANCSLGAAALQSGEYQVREQDLYTEVVLKGTSKEKVTNCLKVIQKTVMKRHSNIFNTHVSLIKMQIDGLKETYDFKNQMILDIIESTDDPILGNLRAYSKFDLNLIEMEKQSAIAPWNLNLQTFLRTKKNTSILDFRVYDAQVKNFNSTPMAIALCALISFVIFIVYVFIRYQKKLNL